jgi:hypothetical protein
MDSPELIPKVEGQILINPDCSITIQNFTIEGGTMRDLQNLAIQRVKTAAALLEDL